ncbi:MAG TPA: hypothetical protein VD948_08680 [Rhodothermales bacterium]|nr:hypothetical protein [Rhodothermales bacterium]
MKVRAYQPQNAPVRVVMPNPAARIPAETEQEYVQRLAAALAPTVERETRVTTNDDLELVTVPESDEEYRARVLSLAQDKAVAEPEGRRPAESDEDFYPRIFADAEAKDPTLQGLPFVELDSADLPPREELCTDCGMVHPTRNQWRVTGDTVQRDPAAPNRHVDRAHALRDLRAELAKPLPDPVAAARLQLAALGADL